ncbi:MAG: HNH endonuclease [bacterium]|nr:HNH endonuclease [bacterium]
MGVTANHPIYSTTVQDWRLAGELAIGEQVLTYAGSATLTGKRPALAQRVYNLEVQEVHNFLVAEVGGVVHNSCFNAVKELLKDFVTHKRVGGKSGAIRNGNKVDLPDGRSVPISAKEFPDFTGFTAKTSNGIPLAKKIDNLKGNDDRIFDNNKANTWLQNSGHLNDFDSYWINPTYGSPVKLTKNGVEKTYTWHHHENGKTMMLVEQSVHNSVQHVGGASLISSGATTSIDDFTTIFPDPAF